MKIKILKGKNRTMDDFLAEHYDEFLQLVNSRNGYDIVNMQEAESGGY